MKRRLIGDYLPLEDIGSKSAREKSARHGHISTLHPWWARRPLAASRATTYAALVDIPEDRESTAEFVAELSKWSNPIPPDIINKARHDIMKCHRARCTTSASEDIPKVLDPFGGGGSIPLEGLRLGCQTYSNDYNPVACIIQKCTLEFPLRYSDGNTKGHSRLVADIRKWANWVLEESRKEIGKFYPDDKDGYIPSGYVWARAVPCQNPACGAEIPLMRQFWLAKRQKKKISLYPIVEKREVTFEIVGDGHAEFPPDFDPTKGTIHKAKATCLVCGTTTTPDMTKKLFQSDQAHDRMVAVILRHGKKPGKFYRSATPKDAKIVESVAAVLDDKRLEYERTYGMDPLPDEILSTPDNKEFKPGSPQWHPLRPVLYGMTRWLDLFNVRQKLVMTVFLSKIRQVEELIRQVEDSEYTKVLICYMAILLDRMADKNATLVTYQPNRENIAHVFVRQALSMVWDYVELNPFDNQGWPNMTEWVCRAVEHCTKINNSPAKITCASATSLPYEENFFDAVLTDPPYYDNITYAIISDFFYVWLKRSVGHLFPDLFVTPLTPKTKEVIVNETYAINVAGHKLPEIKTAKDYENLLSQSLSEIYRVLKPNGVLVLVYTHKSVIGWETLINAILASGLVITGTWPIHTEMKARMTAKGNAALASSIYIAGRKMPKQGIGFYGEILKELRRHLEGRLATFWKMKLRGADFFVSAIGASIEVFAKYDTIQNDAGDVIDVAAFLHDIRRMVSDYAISKIMHGTIAESVPPIARLYVLWRWSFGTTKVQFDNALKMCQGIGVDIDRELKRSDGLLKKAGEYIAMLGPEQRKLDKIDQTDLLDVLHSVLLLWKDSNRTGIKDVLRDSGYDRVETLYAVAKAISEANPNSRESQLIDGFLTGKDTMIVSTISSGSYQTRFISDTDGGVMVS